CQLLAVAQVAELNGEFADHGQSAAVRMEMNAARLEPRRQILPRRTRRQIIDPDRAIRPGKCYQPAIWTERWQGPITALRYFQDRLAAAQIPHVVVVLTPVEVVRGQVTTVGAELGLVDREPEPGQGDDLLMVRDSADTQLTRTDIAFLRMVSGS